MVPEAKLSFILSTTHIPSKFQRQTLQSKQAVRHSSTDALGLTPGTRFFTPLGLEAPAQGPDARLFLG